jgi:hypothetical protein
MPRSYLTGGVYSPFAPALSDLFGTKTIQGSHGIVVRPDRKNLGGIFGPGYGRLESALQQLMGPMSGLENFATGLDFEGPLQQALGTFGELGDVAGRLAETGLKTDVGAYKEKAIRDFREDFLPALAERVSPTYSGFGDIGAREAGRISTDLAAILAELNDPVRRAGALGGLGQAAGIFGTFPMAAASDLLQTGQAFRRASPAGRTFDIFSALAGVPVQASFGVGSSDTSTDKFAKTAQAIASLGEAGASIQQARK